VLGVHGFGRLLVSADCQFLAPAQQGDRCEVRSRIARFGGASFVVAHDIVRSDGTTLAKGSEKRVWGRYLNGPGTPMKGQQIPEEVKALFRAR
jgi:4-hydroxybenzoyl-CoA thioesterase